MLKIKKLNNKSFTLVELLIVTAISGAIGAAILGVFSAGVNVYKKVRVYENGRLNTFLAMEKMERDLHNTFLFNAIPFLGGKNSISFFGLVGGSCGRISYAFDSSQGYIIKTQIPYPGVSEMAKLSDVMPAGNLSFSYCYYDSVNKNYLWKESWQDAVNLPFAVKISIQSKSDDNKEEFTRTVIIQP